MSQEQQQQQQQQQQEQQQQQIEHMEGLKKRTIPDESEDEIKKTKS